MAKRLQSKRPLVTLFCNEIVAEVMFPKRQTGKIAILCQGAPSSPFKPAVLRHFATAGYVAILPRYRGTWESRGEFLKRSPHEDILDIMHALRSKQKIFSLFDERWFPVRVKDIVLFGASFGGPAVILASRHPLVRRAVAFAPVCDFRRTGPAEPFSWFEYYTKSAFGGAYRASEKCWRKLERGQFYSPLIEASTINGRKLLLVHAVDDEVVLAETTRQFALAVGATLITPKKGGHFGLRHFTHTRYWKLVQDFLRQKKS